MHSQGESGMEMSQALFRHWISTLIIMPLQPTDIKSLSNLHGTFRQSIDNLFNLFNSDTGSIIDRYNATTKDIQQFLARAEQEQRKVRAMGANWSFTRVAYTSDWILSTTR